RGLPVDIQVHVALSARRWPLCTEVLRGWDPRFDEGIFEAYGHRDLVRVFTPLVVVRTAAGKLVENWLEQCDWNDPLYRRRGADEWTLLGSRPKAGAPPRRIDALATAEAGLRDPERKQEISTAKARELVELTARRAGKIRRTLLRHLHETVLEQARRIAAA